MKYDREFPEKYNYELLDSFKLTKAAVDIQKLIVADLGFDNARFLVPGLRKALNLIYDVDQCNR